MTACINTCVHMASAEARRGHQAPWKCGYRKCGIWVLETKPRPSERAAVSWQPFSVCAYIDTFN